MTYFFTVSETVQSRIQSL